MDNQLISIQNLKQSWKDLRIEIEKSKKFKPEAFHAVFSETYALLSEHAVESVLDKCYVGLIAEAFLFANMNDEALDEASLAALVLTERMLSYCAFHASSASECPTIYIAEARKEIPLNFDDARSSIAELTKIFNDLYWQKTKG